MAATDRVEFSDGSAHYQPDTVTHPSTNRARRKQTSLIKTDALPLRKTTPSYIKPGICCLWSVSNYIDW